MLVGKTKLKYCRGAFMNTQLYGEIYSTIDNNLSTIISGCSNIENASYMFAGCSMLGENSSKPYSIPSKLFSDCAGKLKDTSYMFAGCGFSKGI